jgi:hypothetical protein
MKVQAVLTKKSAKKEQENGSALTRQAKLAQSCWALKGLREKGRVAITRNQHAQSLRNLAHAQIRMHRYACTDTHAQIHRASHTGASRFDVPTFFLAFY